MIRFRILLILVLYSVISCSDNYSIATNELLNVGYSNIEIIGSDLFGFACDSHINDGLYVSFTATDKNNKHITGVVCLNNPTNQIKILNTVKGE